MWDLGVWLGVARTRFGCTTEGSGRGRPEPQRCLAAHRPTHQARGTQTLPPEMLCWTWPCERRSAQLHKSIRKERSGWGQKQHQGGLIDCGAHVVGHMEGYHGADHPPLRTGVDSCVACASTQKGNRCTPPPAIILSATPAAVRPATDAHMYGRKVTDKLLTWEHMTRRIGSNLSKECEE